MKKIAFCIFLFFIQYNSGLCQWIQSNGPYGNTYVTGIAKVGTSIVASTKCGIFYKNSINDTWKLINSYGTNCFVQKGDSIFTGTYEGGIRFFTFSTKESQSQYMGNQKIKCILKNGSFIFAGGDDFGFISYNNSTKKWISFNIGLPVEIRTIPKGATYNSFTVNCLELKDLYLYCGTKEGIYRSTIDNISWEKFSAGLKPGVVKIIKRIDDFLYSAVENQLYVSDNSGKSWSLIYKAQSTVTSIEKFQGKIFIGTEKNGILLNNGFDYNFSSLNTNLTDSSITVISALDTVLICGTSLKGIFYLKNNSWKNNNQGLICSVVNSLTSNKSEIYATDESSLYRLTNSRIWENISPVGGKRYLHRVVMLGDSLFLSGNIYETIIGTQFIKYSGDNGVNWNSLTLPTVTEFIDDPWRLYVAGKELYIWEYSRLFRLNRKDLSWHDMSYPSTYCNNINSFLIFNSTPFVATCGNAQLLKMNNNKKWEYANDKLPPSREIISLFNNRNTIFCLSYAHGLYSSFNNGKSWEYASKGIVSDHTYSISDFTFNDTILFISIYYEGIFATNSNGKYWTNVNKGLKNQKVLSLKIVGDTLYAGTNGNGVWKLPVNGIDFSNNEVRTLNELKVYPNPASENIWLSVSSGIFRIFDMRGSLVKSGVINSNRIETSELRKGVYIIQVISDGKRMIAKFEIID